MMVELENQLDFDHLVSAIQQIHEHLASRAARAVNLSLTLRNWSIGLYIQEYEMKGEDRAKYGTNLLEKLSERLQKDGFKRVSVRELRRYRQLYLVYPQIWESVNTEFRNLLPDAVNQLLPTIRESATPEWQLPPETLVTKLSFTHLVELLAIEEMSKRNFYEIECIRGNWSVRELKRQIGSLYYERSGLSKNKEKLAELAQSGAEQEPAALTIRDPYIFEFLGLNSSEVMGESDLDDALLDKLQDFLLELGHGFCFEARQKRILIGDTYGFVDLVFYHRILKCHILIDLKMQGFSHENVGQLNTYVSWYRKNMLSEGDNLPIGILLCTQKDQALVEYALAGMDNSLFVSKYQLELPSTEQMRQFLEKNIPKVEQGQTT